nr:Protein K02G10.15 [Haemonchus contortus]
MELRNATWLSVLFLLLMAVDAISSHSRFMVRKGGRLERLHKRTLFEWRHAHRHLRHRHHRHKRRRHERDGDPKIGHIVAQMDSYVRPRFGRSVRFREMPTSA